MKQDSPRPSDDCFIQLARSHMLVELLAGLAHEMGQPLTALGLYLETAAQLETAQLEAGRSAADSGFLGLLPSINVESTRAAESLRRIRQLLSETTAVQSQVMLNSLIVEIVELMQHPITHPRTSIDLQLETTPGATRVLVDPARIRQLLISLIQNALDAMRDTAAAERSIAISSQCADGMVEVRIHDAGSGIPAVHEDRVFEPYFSTKSCGAGVGLSGCRLIVESYGGWIRVESTSTCHTTIVFGVPQARSLAGVP